MDGKQDKHTGKVRTESLTRGDFLARSAGTLLATAMGGSVCLGGPSNNTQAHLWKGRSGSKVMRWDVITIGNLSRNRYWGEGDERGVRSAICTCTLISGQGFRLLVDPSLAEAAEMIKELDRRTGLKPNDISAVFVTHKHGDHFAGIRHFPQARWLAAPAVAEILNPSGKLPRLVEACSDRLFEAIEVISTPGHTDTHHSLRFDCKGLSVAVAGDAVPTQDFFGERRGYYNAVDFERSARTMDQLASLADIIVPGHDNFFLVDTFK